MKINFIYSSLFILLLTIQQITAQEIPVINIKEASVELRDLDIKVEVNGNIATTTYDMTFYNPNNRVLEGELSFPLDQGQNVSKFGLDLNGELREAVIVEKELGRVAFENTVKQQIDPALLEKTVGNNYKARIYPIPAKGTKRIVLSYDQELTLQNNAHYISIPLKFEQELKNFKLEIIVFKQVEKPVVEEGKVANFTFKNWNENFIAKIEKRNYKANSPLKIKIPIELSLEKVLTYEDYFYIYKALDPKTRLKSKPKSITILWDASLSLENRQLKKELEVLDNYFSFLGNVDIYLKVFSNEIFSEQKISVKNGDWEVLKKALSNTIYDGGTSYKNLNLNDGTDEVLLFTDGIENLGDFAKYGSIPVYCINSVSKANHNLLEQLSNTTGGNYINLNKVNVELANELLINETYRYLGVKNNGNKLLETYPNTITNVTNDFSISGKNFQDGDKITLLFGYGKTVENEIEILLESQEKSSKKVKELWANKKIKSLSFKKDENREELINTSKKYQIISPFTSLIVLDRIEDYVRYNIEPPADLLEEFTKQIAISDRNERNRKSRLKDFNDTLHENYINIFSWWGTDFNYNREKESKSKVIISNRDQEGTNSTVEINNNIDRNMPYVSGVVSNAHGPLPGVFVLVKNTTIGTQTDFDGNYELNATEGDVLVFEFLGMKTMEVTLSNANVVSVEMEEDESELEEVVVIGYGAVEQDNETDVSFSSQFVSGEEIRGVPGNSSTTAIRGNASITASSKPLYVVDGTVVGEYVDTSALEITEMFVLKGEQSTAVFGAQAAAGVVVIKTKNGVKNNLEEILEMEALIDDNIELKPWEPNAPYLIALNKEESISQAYEKYLQLRKEYFNVPSFYIDVADYFEEKGDREKALMILTNLAEIELENYELLKVLAFKLEGYNRYDLAINIYNEILRIRPEDIQSYRDLSLCYVEIGEYQQALDGLYKIVNGELLEKDLDRSSEGIEAIALVEMNNLISKYGDNLNLNAIDAKFIKHMPMDIRVVIDWNHNDTDIDLWVTDPNQEKCFYKHNKTKIGGRISNDMTEGFGPESFMLKKAIAGDYTIAVNYYSDAKQKISGPTFLKVTIFKNYSENNETKTTLIYRLDKKEENLEVGDIKF